MFSDDEACNSTEKCSNLITHLSQFYGTFAGTKLEDVDSDPEKIVELRLATETIFV